MTQQSKLEQHKTAHVRYVKSTNLGEGQKGEVTERYIVPTFIPQPNIKAIDVTDLSEEDRAAVEQSLAEYAEYYKAAINTIFSYEDWLSHTQGDAGKGPVKWRTFRQDNLVVLAE